MSARKQLGDAKTAGQDTTGEFEFEWKDPARRFSNDQVLAGLRAFAATVNNQPFRRTDFAAWPNRPFCADTAVKRFGSWNAALEQIGLGPAPSTKLAPETLIETLERVWRRHGRPPGWAVLRKLAGMSPYPYARVWGSLRRACEALARHHRGQITREQLLAGNPQMHRRKRARQIPLHTRWHVLKRDRYRCRVCGRSPATAKVELHVDHVRPMSKGGTNEPSNLRTLCHECNSGRGDGRRPRIRAG